ncbi:hypothetical protein PR048_025477 [Dryococelus australis]|uniref:Uncharacterized protein n=1 Tax=Dryococelus australis TaxID=614101 RepID=A0ABQ9GRI0_9NEOP|nr:hypothetical protein PR048_025477 [Dryococelus australis]
MCAGTNIKVCEISFIDPAPSTSASFPLDIIVNEISLSQPTVILSENQWTDPSGRNEQFDFCMQSGINSEVREELRDVTPIKIFEMFITEDILQMMVEQTNKYAEQTFNNKEQVEGDRLHKISHLTEKLKRNLDTIRDSVYHSREGWQSNSIFRTSPASKESSCSYCVLPTDIHGISVFIVARKGILVEQCQQKYFILELLLNSQIIYKLCSIKKLPVAAFKEEIVKELLKKPIEIEVCENSP